MKLRTTRTQILDLFTAREIISVEEISQVLHLSAANTRHHLAILRDEGQIQVIGTRLQGGRGRPPQLFQLSQPRLEHNLGNLSHILLMYLNSNHENAMPKAVLDFLSSALSNVYTNNPNRAEQKQSLSQLLSGCVKHLNVMHYKARWEAHSNGPRLMLNHCPYWQIIAEHPELCQVDQQLIHNLLGVGVVQAAKLELTPPGLRVCIFNINTKKHTQTAEA